MRKKKRKEDEQTLEELNSAYRRSQAKCQLVQSSYIKRIELFLFSVFMEESWTRSCVQKFTTSV